MTVTLLSLVALLCFPVSAVAQTGSSGVAVKQAARAGEDVFELLAGEEWGATFGATDIPASHFPIEILSVEFARGSAANFCASGCGTLATSLCLYAGDVDSLGPLQFLMRQPQVLGECIGEFDLISVPNAPERNRVIMAPPFMVTVRLAATPKVNTDSGSGFDQAGKLADEQVGAWGGLCNGIPASVPHGRGRVSITYRRMNRSAWPFMAFFTVCSKNAECSCEIHASDVSSASAEMVRIEKTNSDVATEDQVAWRPNFLVILLDDLGIEFFSDYDAINKTLGLNTDGSNPWHYPDMRTIEAERDRGIIFDNAYAMPTCSPSRYSLITGRYPSRHGLGSVVNRGPAKARYTEADSISGVLEVTIAHALKTAGYSTGWVGKGHLAEYTQKGGSGGEMMTKKLGFDLFRGTVKGSVSPDMVAADGHEPGYWNYEWYDSKENKAVVNSKVYITTKLERETASAINSAMTEPFFMLMAPHAVHAPNGGADRSAKSGSFPAESDAGVDAATWSGSSLYPYVDRMDEWVSHRAAMEALDVQLDSLINGPNGLKERGVYDRTIIFIVGDNGSATSIMRMAAAFGEDLGQAYKTAMVRARLKGSAFRQGGRIPLIVSGPPELLKGTPGRRSAINVNIVDLFSTVLELAGVEQTAVVGTRPIDGISFAPVLCSDGADAAHPRTWNYHESFRPLGDTSLLVKGDRHDKRLEMVYQGTRYSYVQTLNASLELFHNLDEDPMELRPLPNSGPAFDALKAEMNALLASF